MVFEFSASFLIKCLVLMFLYPVPNEIINQNVVHIFSLKNIFFAHRKHTVNGGVFPMPMPLFYCAAFCAMRMPAVEFLLLL